MRESFRNILLSLRDVLVSAGPVAFLAVSMLLLAYWWLDPNPPKRVRLATGPAQSAYEEFGKRYARALAAEGIEVDLVASEGSSDNLRILRDGKADLGFVRGGSATPDQPSGEEENLESLGSLFLEPVWLFYRTKAARKISPDGVLRSLGQLKGLRVNVGATGSGVPNLMEKLLAVNRVEAKDLVLSRLEQTPATVAFLSGHLDALVFASAPESLMVQMLLQTPGVQLMSFSQSDAYSRRFPFLSPVTLPRGVVDLAADIPPDDIRLVASTTSLLTRNATHPALKDLFAQTAQALHSAAGWFNRAREFPNTRTSEIAVAKEGERAINEPAPLLQRYLPFWISNLVGRMWLVLGVIVAVLLPLSRIVPPLYAFRVRSRVFRWYGQLRDIEARFDANTAQAPALLEELIGIESRVGKISLPLSYTDELYSLRNHIHFVRDRLQRAI